MKQLLILFSSILLFAGCGVHRTMQTQSTLNETPEEVSANTLIVYYDEQIGKGPLLKEAQRMQAEVIYDYQNFNAVALKVRNATRIKRAIRRLQRVKGVLQVSRNQIMKLH